MLWKRLRSFEFKLLPYLKLEVNDLPNIKSAIKSVKQNARKNESNSHTKATMRTAIRKAELAIENKDENTTEAVRHAIKLMDTAARKGLIHKNNASRQKARLTKNAAQ